jgi:hypothetical protein
MYLRDVYDLENNAEYREKSNTIMRLAVGTIIHYVAPKENITTANQSNKLFVELDYKSIYK